MSIIAFQYSQDHLASGHDAVLGKGVTANAYSQLIGTPFSFSKSYWTNTAFDQDKPQDPGDGSNYHCYMGSNAQYAGTFGEVPAASKELWLRFVSWMYGTTPNGSSLDTSTNGTVFAQFYNWDGTRLKLVADLFTQSSGQLYYRLFKTTEGVDTLDRSYPLGSGSLYTAFDPVTKMAVYDFRVLLDATAGFIQVYDRTVTRIAEGIGPTVNTLPVTHVRINNVVLTGNQNLTYRFPMYQIVADEPTFGMAVMPLHAKSNGSYADQRSGSYAQFDKNYYNYTGRDTPVLERDETKSVKSSFVFQNAVDKALPANYNVLAVEARFGLDVTKVDLGSMALSGFLKNTVSGKEYSKDFYPVASNVNSFATGVPSVRQLRFDVNLDTGNPWQQGDLATIEFGIKL